MRDNKITDESKIENKQDGGDVQQEKNMNLTNVNFSPNMQNIKLKKLFQRSKLNRILKSQEGPMDLKKSIFYDK